MSQILQNFIKFQKCQLYNLVDFEKCCKTRIIFNRRRYSRKRAKFAENLAKVKRLDVPHRPAERDLTSSERNLQARSTSEREKGRPNHTLELSLPAFLHFAFLFFETSSQNVFSERRLLSLFLPFFS